MMFVNFWKKSTQASAVCILCKPLMFHISFTRSPILHQLST